MEKLDVPQASEVGTACHMALEMGLKQGILPLQGSRLRIAAEDDDHAALSPSASPRWLVCPGSTALCSKMLSLKRNIEVEVTQEMLDWVEQVLLWILSYKAQHPGCVVYSEERAKAGAAFGCPDDMWGTADVVIVNRQDLELVVLDAKFGYNEVQAYQNSQLQLYAIGLASDFGWAFSKYKLVIAQPRSEDPFKTWERSHAELAEDRERLRPKVNQAHYALHGGLPLRLVATKDGCAWCPAAGVCPELQRRTLELARREFMNPELLPREKLVELLQVAPLVRDALNAAEAHALRLLELGQSIPGYKRVLGSKRKVWIDEVAAGNRLQALGVPDVWKPEMQYTPAQARKKLGKHYEDMLDELIETPLGEPCLASEEDPRPPLPAEFERC